MNRELTQDECRDQRALLKILERNKLAEWLGGEQYWLAVVRQLEAMQITGTTDGEDLAELTDEDARERPWVMVKDYGMDKWAGPNVLLSAPPKTEKYIVVDGTDDHAPYYWDQARKATENELKKAGITQ
jgi:hypothetical protein